MITITKATSRNKAGDWYDWIIDIAGHGSNWAGILLEFHSVRQWCEATWGRSLEFDLYYILDRQDLGENAVCMHPHWTHSLSLSPPRNQIYLNSEIELNMFKEHFGIK